MAEIEGSLCDECGNRVGPLGCCATHRRRQAHLEAIQRKLDDLERETKQLRAMVVKAIKGD